MATGIFNNLVNAVTRTNQVTRAEAPQKVSDESHEQGQVDKQASTKPPSAEELKSTVNNLNNMVQVQQRALQFSFNEDNGNPIITVVDSETDKVIRQIPSEEAIELARRMQEFKSGLIQTQV